MVNKREKSLLYNFYFRQTAIVFLYFFISIPFLLLIPSFFPTFFVLILSYLSGTCTFSFADISGRNFSTLLDISERNFLPRWGVHVHPVYPPCVRACYVINYGLSPSGHIDLAYPQPTSPPHLSPNEPKGISAEERDSNQLYWLLLKV